MVLPFENDTSNVIRKISYAHLKHDTLKKILSIFAIALASFLMTAVLLLVSGIMTVNMNGGNSVTGSYHALISGITKEQYQILSKDDRIELLGFNASIESVSDNDVQLNISCSNQDSLTLNGLSISEGTMPQQVNEVLIERDYLIKQGIDAKIGDVISLPIKDQQQAQEFVISGYLETAATGTNRSLYAAIVSTEYFNSVDGWNTLAPMTMIRLKDGYTSNADKIHNTLMQIYADSEIEQSPAMNEAYIELSHPSALMIVAAIVGLLIVIMAGVLVIYCIFYISIINSIRDYGQLRTIGMTEKQIKKLVYKEGNLLSFIAIPIGLAAGILLSYLLIPQGFHFSNLLWVCPLVILLSYFTVKLSISKPAAIASKVSPIEAYRYEMEVNTIRAHKRRKISPAVLAKVQLARNKKKNILTVTSLILAGMLLLTASSVLSSIDAREMSLSGFSMGQFNIGIQNQELRENALEIIENDSPFTEEIYQSLSSVSGLEEISVILNLPVSNDLKAQESDAAIVGFQKDDMDLIERCSLESKIPDYQELSADNLLIVGRPDDFEEYFGVEPKVGASVEMKIFDGKDTKEMNFHIAAVLDQKKIGNDGNKIDMLMLSEDSIEQIAVSNTTYQYIIKVDEKMEQQAQQEIEKILTSAPRLSLSTLFDAIAQNENFLQGISFALTVAILFIGCFAVVNLLNTILTGVIVREKEFALMRSVGMTQRQLTSMICCEGLIVVSVGVLLSILFGSGIGYLICSYLRNELMTYLNYHFPVGVTLTYCAVVLVCSICIIKVALKYQKNISVIELLRR